VPYPAGDWQDHHQLAGLTGTYWLDHFEGRDEVLTRARASTLVFDQVIRDLASCRASVSLRSCPLEHHEHAHRVVLRQSTLRHATPIRVGERDIDGTWVVGGVIERGVYTSPADFAHAPVLTNRLRQPSRCLVWGIDFVVRAGQLELATDPFADPLLPAAPVFDALGQVVDQELVLWAHEARRDDGWLGRLYGAPVGLPGPSTPERLQLLDGGYDALTGGTSSRAFRKMLEAVCGVRLADEDATVEVVQADPAGLLVVTDRAVHWFAATATALVAPGDRVAGGQALADTLQIDSLHSGAVPAGLTTLELPASLLGLEEPFPVQFSRAPLPITFDADGQGGLRASFEVTDTSADNIRFWNIVHARGVAAGRTLAQALQARGQALPEMIDGLAFLCEHWLRGCGLLVRIREGDLGAGALGLSQLAAARQLLPPEQGVLVHRTSGTGVVTVAPL
jgi:hypothetical protein